MDIRRCLLFLVAATICSSEEAANPFLVKRDVILSMLPDKNFDKCTTPYGRTGFCKHISYCPMPNMNTSLTRLVDNFCVINEKSIGICCPETFIKKLGPKPVKTILNANDATDDSYAKLKSENRGCGITTKQFPKLKGQRLSEPDDWPWMVAVIRRNYSQSWCGGTLITNRLVLTAAHCIFDLKMTELFVRLGEYDFKQYNETRIRDYNIGSMVWHEDYDSNNYANDIGLIKIEPTIYNTYIWPACLPSFDETWEGYNAIVIGWGTKWFGGPFSHVLLEVDVPIWKNQDCRKSYVERVTENLICAGAEYGRRDSCQGDSGGPLMVKLPNHRWVVIGIVSWGIGCADYLRPGVYTRVNKYIQWIVENSDVK